jgi:hypothetical protein
MSVRRKAASELQGDLWPLHAAAAKTKRERDSGRGTHGRPWCALCRVDTLAAGEFFMVKDETWDAAVRTDSFLRDSFLCIGCLEHRLGRRLVPSDFSDVPINEIHGGKSSRLRNRMTVTLRSSMII